MNRALDDIMAAPDRNHIKARVDDWARRIDQLYASLIRWLPDGWRYDSDRAITMNEELMRDAGVPPRQLPVLALHSPTGTVSIEPRALWVVGTNGRLDLKTGQVPYIIVDTADPFQTPSWQIAELVNRKNLRPLDAASFRAAL